MGMKKDKDKVFLWFNVQFRTLPAIAVVEHPDCINEP